MTDRIARAAGTAKLLWLAWAGALAACSGPNATETPDRPSASIEGDRSCERDRDCLPRSGFSGGSYHCVCGYCLPVDVPEPDLCEAPETPVAPRPPVDSGGTGGGPETPECAGTPPVCFCGAATCDPTGVWRCPDPEDYGQLCPGNDPTLCGARKGCGGECGGGQEMPACHQGTARCTEPAGLWVCVGDGCVPEAGQPCDRPGHCGAVYNCLGECVGGDAAPDCQCGAPTCQADGTWTPCVDPPNLGARCAADAQSCGGVVGCGGCEGGTSRPYCASGQVPVCQASGEWSACDAELSCTVTASEVPGSRHGEACPGVSADTWRCAWDTGLGVAVSQVCRGGSWQNYHVAPDCCGRCSGDFSPDCARSGE